MQSLIVVRFGRGILAELETIQRNTQRATGKISVTVILTEYAEACEKLCVLSLPVIQSVPDVHVVGELFPQGSFQLALGLDGLQRLTQLSLRDLFQADGILQLAVEELSVLLETTDFMLQTLKLNLIKE